MTQTKILGFLLILLITLLLLPSVNATHFIWDHCDGPGKKMNVNNWASESLYPILDEEDWVDVYLDKSGTYKAYLYGPSGADFDLYIYKNCISGQVGSGTTGSANETVQFNISTTGYYHFQIKRYSGSGTWNLYVEFIPQVCTANFTHACLSNDVYWKNSCGDWGDKKQECGDNSYGSWSYTCNDNNVYRQRSVTLKGCSSGNCYSNNSTESELYQSCGTNQYCSSGQCKTFACTKASDCGTTGYTGNNYCYDGDVYRDYAESYCLNPSTTSASCLNQTQKVKQKDCGDTTYGNWSNNYCSNDNIIQSRTITTPGCSSASCTSSNSTETKTIENCDNKNYADSFEFYCSGSQLRKKQLYHDYTCSSSYGVYCSEGSSYYINDQSVENCSYGCSGNTCIVPKPNLTVSESDIWIER